MKKLLKNLFDKFYYEKKTIVMEYFTEDDYEMEEYHNPFLGICCYDEIKIVE